MRINFRGHIFVQQTRNKWQKKKRNEFRGKKHWWSLNLNWHKFRGSFSNQIFDCATKFFISILSEFVIERNTRPRRQRLRHTYQIRQESEFHRKTIKWFFFHRSIWFSLRARAQPCGCVQLHFVSFDTLLILTNTAEIGVFLDFFFSMVLKLFGRLKPLIQFQVQSIINSWSSIYRRIICNSAYDTHPIIIIKLNREREELPARPSNYFTENQFGQIFDAEPNLFHHLLHYLIRTEQIRYTH